MHLIGPWMDFWLGMAKTFTGLETIGSKFLFQGQKIFAGTICQYQPQSCRDLKTRHDTEDLTRACCEGIRYLTEGSRFDGGNGSG
jgi:hypothetical protein